MIFLEPLNGLVLALLGVVGGERHQPKFCNQTGATDHLWRRGLAGPFGFGSSCGLSLSRAKAAQTAKADRQPTQELRERKRHSMFFRCAINCQLTLIDICGNYLNEESSESYIAVPAALKLAIPEASPSLYLGLSLGLTFPLNIILGIPLYSYLADWAI
jgi:hypothetical protein